MEQPFAFDACMLQQIALARGLVNAAGWIFLDHEVLSNAATHGPPFALSLALRGVCC
jgi:hypothetical protein